MNRVELHPFSWDRMIAAVDAVRERARRISAVLSQAGIPYAVIGGHAVAAWVARVDVEAIRNTKNVDLLIRREDLPRVMKAAESVGFIYRFVNGIDLFLDGPDGSVRSAVHLVFAGERVKANELLPAPDVTESEPGPEYTVVKLEPLVLMKLTAFRPSDQVHLMDLFQVGLIDASWCDRLPDELAARLRQIIGANEAEM